MVRFLLLTASITLLAAPAAAQRAADVQAAAQAFEEGQRAQLRGEHGRAAQLFELADRSAPSAAALRSAIRSHRAAGALARAATLAERAQERYADDAGTTELATEVIEEARGSLGRLEVECEPECSLLLDGRTAGAGRLPRWVLFAPAGSHRVTAGFGDAGEVGREVELSVGADERVGFEAPEAEPEEAEPEPTPEPTPLAPLAPPPPSAEGGGGGLHPAIFLTAAGVTLLGGALTLWSGLDTLDARDAYEADPTETGYLDGRGREDRTNGLLIGTAIVGLATVVLAIFTDWDGGDDVPPVSFFVGPEGGALSVQGRFGGVL